MKIGDVPSGEGFWAAGKQFFRGNPDGFQGNRLGMLIFFKQALVKIELIPEKLTIEKKRNIIINYIEGEKKYGN